MSCRTTVLTFLCLSLAVFVSEPLLANSDREAKQAELDTACETARQEKLAPLRDQLVKECVADKQFDTESECRVFYADYGNRTGGAGRGRAAMFYDLPPCIEAFEFQNSQRSGG